LGGGGEGREGAGQFTSGMNRNGKDAIVEKKDSEERIRFRAGGGKRRNVVPSGEEG